MDHWRNQNRDKKNTWGAMQTKTTIQNLSGAAKAALGGKFIVINAYLKKQEKSQTT